MDRRMLGTIALLASALGGCRQVFGLDPPAIGADAAEPDDALLPSDGTVCYGTWSAVRSCFARPPIGHVVLSNSFDTDTPVNCSYMEPDRCVVTGETITVPSGAMVQVTGTRALVLIATTITIEGTLDASSRGTARGAANVTTCSFNGGISGDSGGAGGSFGGKGGNGGGAGGGLAGDVLAAPMSLRGGCRGQGSRAGYGGGVLYLSASTSIDVQPSGVLAANGQGGLLTPAPTAGGSGGGAGGFIGLDAPTVVVLGSVFANGGGGAEGSGSANAGAAGEDPTVWNVAAEGGTGTVNGGNGGDGGERSTPAQSGGIAAGSGGGGGGGVGFVLVYTSGPAPSGMISPVPQLMTSS